MLFLPFDCAVDLQVKMRDDVAARSHGPDDLSRPHVVSGRNARGIEVSVDREEFLASSAVFDHHVEPQNAAPLNCVHPATGDAADRSALGELQIHTRVLARVLPGIEVVGPHVAGRVVELGSDLWNPPWLDELRERKCEHCEIVWRNGDELRIGYLTICPIPFLWCAHRSPVRHPRDRVHRPDERWEFLRRLMLCAAIPNAPRDVREERRRGGDAQSGERKRNAGNEDASTTPPKPPLQSDKNSVCVH